MSFRDAFFDGVKKSLEKYGKNELQKKLKERGVKQSRYSNIINGKSENPQLDAVIAFIENFDHDTYLEFVKSIRSDFPLDVIDLEGMHEVPTYNIDNINVVLAAMPEHKNREGLRLVLRDIEPVFKLQIPERYFPSDFAVRILGHSMEPDIPDRAAVGLTILKSDRDFTAGEMYLCRLPYEGLVLRRVTVVPGRDALEFQALHNDRNAYRSQIMHPDEALPLIYARVRWVAFRK